MVLTSDNGSQFTGKVFQRWLKKQGIRHVKASPYHLQGNGVVERLHRTLNSMVSKLVEKKGNWASVTPMALYFIRSTPCASTGFNPFMARQGWEPVTPIQVLYKVWAQADLGDINLADWVAQNAEKIEFARENALLMTTDVSQKRKIMWDKKANNIESSEGDEVLVRKLGMNLKLTESWEGPFTVTKKNSPLSYTVDLGDRRIHSVHVQLMKKYNRETQQNRVNRLTSVFEADTQTDNILMRYAEVHIGEQQLHETEIQQVQKLLDKYPDVMTTEPGLTTITEFGIDTGDIPPIFQTPYNTPAALKSSIDKEIDWLLDKNYIRPSTSPWSFQSKVHCCYDKSLFMCCQECH